MDRVRTVIVGGGPAGLATALFLARSEPERADRIVVLEKGRYPREKYCAGAVGGRADRLLATIGVVLDVPSMPIGGLAVRAMGKTVVVRESGAGRVVRRLEYDAALARAACDRGIRIVQGVTVRGIQVRSNGVEVDTTRGAYFGQVVVGADGVQSIVRRCLRIAPTPLHAQALEVDTEGVSSDMDDDLLVFDVDNRQLRGYYWDFPTIVQGRRMVCRGVYYLRGTPRIEVQDALADALAARGLDLRRYRRKRYAERGFYPGLPIARYRALLVGEAAGIDSVTGEGIAQAIQYGAVAARYLARKYRDNDFAFLDWPRQVRASMVGRDLFVRYLAHGLFYGPQRPRTERFLLETPEFMQIGLQHFAGKPWSARAAMQAAMGAWRLAAS